MKKLCFLILSGTTSARSGMSELSARETVVAVMVFTVIVLIASLSAIQLYNYSKNKKD